MSNHTPCDCNHCQQTETRLAAEVEERNKKAKALDTACEHDWYYQSKHTHRCATCGEIALV